MFDTSALIALGVAVLSVAVAMTRYITRLQCKIEQERIGHQLEGIQKELADVKVAHSALREDVQRAQKVGNEPLFEKLFIDDALNRIMGQVKATAGSIYIPLSNEPSNDVTELVFLSILPLTAETKLLKQKPIPMASMAGKCFTSGEPLIAVATETSDEHFASTDHISGFSPFNLINYPLTVSGKTVGVLQLMKNDDATGFDEQDRNIASEFASEIAPKISEFLLLQNSRELLGISHEQPRTEATIIFCDLTNSSRLYQEIGTDIAVRFINEYLERICEIAINSGAAVENYSGDGVIFKFNVPNALDDHAYKAIEAAWQMLSAFEQLKTEWSYISNVVENVYLRSGMSTGPVTEAVLGHSQYQYLTIVGKPVNTAANLCAVADRTRNILLIDERLYHETNHRILTSPIKETLLNKLHMHTKAAYVVTGTMNDIICIMG